MLLLRIPTIADEAVLRFAHQELEAEGTQKFLLHGFDGANTNFYEYIEVVAQYSEGRNLPEGAVQDSYLIAEVGGEIVGRISVRHSLNDFLFNFGGHIGYMVRPGFRLRGYASEMLRQALLLAKELHISKVLITCNDDNLGSIKVIERQGGVLENTVVEEGQLLRRYWIDNS